MNMDIILGLVRHVLTAVGGILVAKGFIDETTLTQVVGAVITIGGAVWSVLAKKAPAEAKAP